MDVWTSQLPAMIWLDLEVATKSGTYYRPTIMSNNTSPSSLLCSLHIPTPNIDSKPSFVSIMYTLEPFSSSQALPGSSSRVVADRLSEAKPGTPASVISGSVGEDGAMSEIEGSECSTLAVDDTH
jgi:hypothetical protein